MGPNYKNKKRILIAIVASLSLLFALTLSLFLYQRAYAGKVLHNVFFDGINLEGKTKPQVKAILQTRMDPLLDNKITTKATNGKEFGVPFSQTGVYFDTDNVVNSAYSYGRSNNFFATLLALSKTAVKKQDLAPKVAFDEKEYGEYIKRTEETLNLPPVDASLSVSGGKVVINTGSSGITVDSSGLKDKIKNEFLQEADSVSIEVPTTPITPTLLTENLADARSKAEVYLTHQIVLTLNGQTYPADSSAIAVWISFGLQNGKYAAWLNEAAINSFLGKIAAKNDVAVIDTKISAVDNTTVLQQGRGGIYIDQKDALNKILAAMASSSTSATIALIQTTKDPQIVKVFPDEGIIPGRFPGKYIDIDVAHQLLTIFEGMNQLGQYIISSGKASTPTPTGTRYIQDKNPMAWSAPYGLYMPWWNGMGGGYGIHELPEWPGGFKEGEAHLGIPVSHGCVRLGVGPAQTVYNWADIGTPVYIHK